MKSSNKLPQILHSPSSVEQTNIKTYRNEWGCSQIQTLNQKKVVIHIKTDRLDLNTITETACNAFARLEKEVNIRQLSLEKARSSECSDKLLELWIKWSDQGDPFHGLWITESVSKRAIGVVALGHSGMPGMPFFSLLLFREQWNRGYESEISHAVLDNLGSMLKSRGYCLDGKLIETVLATSVSANADPNYSLTLHGFEKLTPVEKYDALRYTYRKAVVNQANTKIYRNEWGCSQIQTLNAKKVVIHIKTKRFELNTVTETALNALLRHDKLEKDNVSYFSEKRLKSCIELSDKGDPFHSLLITDSVDKNDIGAITLVHSGKPGIAVNKGELFQGRRGFISEIFSAVVGNLALMLRAEGYSLGGKPIEEIHTKLPSTHLCHVSHYLMIHGFERFAQVEIASILFNFYGKAISDLGPCEVKGN